MKQKLVLFGAGKIGRSFIGQLFSKGGYEVVLVDIFKPVIDELNRRGSYRVIICGEEQTTLTIDNVRGVHFDNHQEVINQLASADIAALSVGQKGLEAAIPLIAEGIKLRYSKNNPTPLDIIIAENIRNGAEFIAERLKPLILPELNIDQCVGLIETSIGKMVPIMTKADMEADPLQVFAEPYNTLILDKKGFKNPIPNIEGVAPKENIKAWVDRKLFIHNLGHAAASYFGYQHNPGATYLWEVLEEPALKERVRETMQQAAHILLTKYPDEFTTEALTEHIDDLLFRFRNKALGDTLYRVGCDLTRKLGADDRLAGAIHEAIKTNRPYNLILEAYKAGCLFRATDENGRLCPADETFVSLYNNEGTDGIIRSIGKLPL